MKISAIPYYFKSIITIVAGFKNFYFIPFIVIKKPFLLKLRNGMNFYIESFLDFWIVKETILDKCYDQLIAPKKDWIIADIGSSIADYDVMNSPKVKRIYGFDSDSSRNILAKKNLVLNNCQNVAIYSKKIINLNYLFEKFKLKTVDLLKIDCEGAEHKIILNTNSVNLQKVKRIVGEYHLFNFRMKNDFKEMLNYLRENGFKIHIKENLVHKNIGYFYGLIKPKVKSAKDNLPS